MGRLFPLSHGGLNKAKTVTHDAQPDGPDMLGIIHAMDSIAVQIPGMQYLKKASLNSRR
jgi:hypothetical protein